MSLLLFVRHGEAAWTEAGYGGLTARGRAQARALGGWWADRDRRLDRIACGPRARHQETAEEVAGVLAARGRPVPDIEVVPDLDEYDAEMVLRLGLPAVLGTEFPPLHVLIAPDPDPAQRRRRMAAFREVTDAWARGAFPCPETVRFDAFFRRVSEALTRLAAEAGRGTTVAAFTSAGPVAAVVGAVLAAAPQPTVALSRVIENTSVTEVLASPGRLGLRSVNLAPHLEGALP